MISYLFVWFSGERTEDSSYLLQEMQDPQGPQSDSIQKVQGA